MSIADMLGVMVGGQLLQMGPPRSLYEDPISPEVALFLGDANRLQGTGHGHTADSALGTLGLRHPHTGPVQIFIRPENMRLSSEPGSTPAYIERVFYYGSYQTVQVILADGTRLKARTESHEIYRPGEAIGVQVSGLVLAFSPSLTV